MALMPWVASVFRAKKQCHRVILLGRSLTVAVHGKSAQSRDVLDIDRTQDDDGPPGSCGVCSFASGGPELMKTAVITLSLLLFTPPEPVVAVRSSVTPAEPLSAEDLKAEARGLVAVGELIPAMAVFEAAYQLAPGDHIIAYEIASAVWKLHDCDKTRTYLLHFVRYADHKTFPNKLEKAARILNEIDASGCGAGGAGPAGSARSARLSGLERGRRTQIQGMASSSVVP